MENNRGKIRERTVSQQTEDIDRLNNLIEQLTARIEELSNPINIRKRMKEYCAQFPDECTGCKLFTEKGCPFDVSRPPSAWDI